MNVLLIYPKFPDTFWSFKHVMKYVNKKASFPPLGLLTVAAMLPREWNLKLVDVNVSELTDSDLDWAEMIMVSGMLIQRVGAEEVIVRAKAKGKKVVVGGPLFANLVDDFLALGVDHFVLGEAENTLAPFLNDLSANQAQTIYQPDAGRWPSMTKVPKPLWHLIDFNHYATIPVQFCRGCPFNCEFCDIRATYGPPRNKANEQFIAELQSLYDANYRGVIFVVDDNLIGNKAKVKSMLRALIEWQKEHHYPFRFLTQADINLAVDDELLDLMVAANFYKVFLGLESPHLASLERCDKDPNLKVDMSEAIKKIHRHGILVMGGFIVGIDGDPNNIFDQLLKFIRQNGVVISMIGLMIVIPGTRLYYRLKAENRLLNASDGDNTNIQLNFVPKMEPKKLISGYKRLVTSAYSTREYYRRIHIMLNNYRPQPKGGRIKLMDIRAFLMSVFLIGLSSTGIYYWTLILRVLFTGQFKSLGMAIELAIDGQHFKRVAKQLRKA